MRRTYSAGGVVINPKGKVLVVSQRGKSWSLPKGHIDAGEDARTAAKREIYEESGISIDNLELIKELGTYERPKMDSENKDDIEEMKVMTMFLFRTKEFKLKPLDKDNPEALWIDKEKVASMLTHPKDKAFFLKVKKEF